ncbi:hypothetical protein ACLOJK_036705 [Asimina triloba]
MASGNVKETWVSFANIAHRFLKSRLGGFYRLKNRRTQKANILFRNGEDDSITAFVRRCYLCVRSSALLETAASVGAAVVAVSVAATLLARTTKTSDSVDNFSKTCEDCGGSGICPECNGEGFILKKLTEESTERARMTAKNMATRYTAGTERARMTAKNMATRYTAGYVFYLQNHAKNR